ncbi:PREDICTED: pancreatic triacylglycerol lipase-like [Ceratosolen solmsi marchali]|uniref:phospholipase A1 n=1 Tax=Ceratosolen solmsi marchali TaxID=326594 RepID=A0AAJ7DWD9_9HYME|nr:PREDICTED: pancreatic triacylglycerol lipase-like [Ceratosolen solmsi marchali]
MRAPTFIILLLFILRIGISRCQPLSAISCAIGRSVDVVWDESELIDASDTVDNEIEVDVEKYVFFYLYTSEDRQGEQINLDNTRRSSNLNTRRDTKIITHGYFSSKDAKSCKIIRDAFLNNGDYNVIVVDWWPLQSLWGPIPSFYWQVAHYVEHVGKYVAKLIDHLADHGIDLKTTTLIGHSLGAHVMGIAAYQARDKVNYIVGLDPALPSFENRNESSRLTADDANVVEVIHTDEGNCGMSLPIGHYDFYPNGGAKQPGCNSNKCSHTRSCELYAESVANEKGFYAYKCSELQDVKKGNCYGDRVLMGGNTKSPVATKGIFYLKTKDSSPFALGK